MEIFLLISEQRSGPFALEHLHDMERLGGLPAETLAWFDGQKQWLPVREFLARYPLPVVQPSTSWRRSGRREPSRLRGLAGALIAAVVGGVALGVLSVAIGAYFTYLWWALGWGVGFTAAQCARSTEQDQVVGLFACGAALVAILLSLAWFDSAVKNMVIIGGFLMLISFPGSLWLAFRTGSQQS
jgi:hypothetical protein